MTYCLAQLHIAVFTHHFYSPSTSNVVDCFCKTQSGPASYMIGFNEHFTSFQQFVMALLCKPDAEFWWCRRSITLSNATYWLLAL